MQDYIASLASCHLAGNSLLNFTLAGAAAVASYALMLLGLWLVTGRLGRLAERTTTPMDDVVVNVLGSTNRWLLLAAALLIGVGLLDLGPDGATEWRRCGSSRSPCS